MRTLGRRCFKSVFTKIKSLIIDHDRFYESQFLNIKLRDKPITIFSNPSPPFRIMLQIAW
jgi:hypothetical protein